MRSIFSSDLAKAGFILVGTVLVVLVCMLAPVPHPGGEAGVLMDLPYHVGPLLGFSEDVTPAEHTILPADTTFARKTYGFAGDARIQRILCSIVLSGAERRSIHRPERCLPAQGYRIESSKTVSIPLASGRSLRATALYLNQPAQTTDGKTVYLHSYYLYWFEGRGMSTPSQATRILLTNWDLLVHRINQRWAYVIIARNVPADYQPGGANADETLTSLEQFVHDIVPSFVQSEMPPEQAVTSTP